MKCDRKSNPRRPVQVPVQWQDSAWFPPVLAAARFPQPRRRRVYWPVQIITDPTVCVGRTMSL
jgi:hypothetical protein